MSGGTDQGFACACGDPNCLNLACGFPFCEGCELHHRAPVGIPCPVDVTALAFEIADGEGSWPVTEEHHRRARVEIGRARGQVDRTEETG